MGLMNLGCVRFHPTLERCGVSRSPRAKLKELMKNIESMLPQNKTLPLCVVWTILVLYPNPLIILLNIERAADIPIDADSVRNLSSNLPDNATFIDEYVEESIEYSYDWQVHNVPWYFPTPKEVIEKSRGDCKARAVLLASILKEKGINYTIGISPIHVWIDYEGKQIGKFEIEYESGKLPPLDIWIKSYKEMLWDSMPFMRKILLFAGLFFIFI